MEPIKIPPIICSLFINKLFIGSFDNPAAVLEAIDESFISIGDKSFTDAQNLQNNDVELFFSAINVTDGSLECYMITNKEIFFPESIKTHYDRIINKYIREISELVNENGFGMC